MRNPASKLLDTGGGDARKETQAELLAHLQEIAARVHVDESRPDLVLQAMLNIEQYLRGVLPELEATLDSSGRAKS